MRGFDGPLPRVAAVICLIAFASVFALQCFHWIAIYSASLGDPTEAALVKKAYWLSRIFVGLFVLADGLAVVILAKTRFIVERLSYGPSRYIVMGLFVLLVTTICIAAVILFAGV